MRASACRAWQPPRRITDDEALSQVKVVMLTTFELDAYIFEAIRSGASGFPVKDTVGASPSSPPAQRSLPRQTRWCGSPSGSGR